MSKLGQALRAKFDTPQAALKALGLDEALINATTGELSMSKKILTRKGAQVMGALVGFLSPKLAADAAINFYPIVGDITTKNFGAKKKSIADEVQRQTKGKLAADATTQGLIELLDGLEKVEEGHDAEPMATEPNSALPMGREEEEKGDGDADMHAGLRAFLEEKGMSPEDIEKACAMVGSGGDEDVGSEKKSEEGLDEEPENMAKIGEAKDRRGARDEPPEFKGKPKVGGGMSEDAVNRAIRVATDSAVRRVRQDAAAVREAERFVRPWVGDLDMAHDSAEAVYRTTLMALGVEDLDDVHPSAYKSILKQIPVPGTRQQPSSESFAQDSVPSTDLTKRIPGLAKIQLM
jgi:uncharacterized protein